MNRDSKKRLMERMTALQGQLKLDPTLLTALVRTGVLTDQEKQAIQVESMPNAKVVILVGFLITKTDKQFKDFVDALKKTATNRHTAELLTTSTSVSSGGGAVGGSSSLTVTKADKDVVPARKDLLVRRGLEEPGVARREQSASNFSLHSLQRIPDEEECSKDACIKRDQKIHSYQKEISDVKQINRQMLIDAANLQNELEESLNLNDNLLSTIKQLSETGRPRQRPPARPGAGKPLQQLQEELEKREADVIEYERKVKYLENEVASLTDQLKDSTRRESVLRRKLKLPLDATADDVAERIAHISGSQADLARKLTEEQNRARNLQTRLEKAKHELSYAKERLRNKSLMYRQQKQSMTTKKQEEDIDQQAAVSEDNRSDSDTSLAISLMKFHQNVRNTGNNFCLLCKNFFELPKTGTGGPCHVHNRPYRYNMWQCCRKENLGAPGCIVLSHCYVFNEDGEDIFTNGEDYIKLGFHNNRP